MDNFKLNYYCMRKQSERIIHMYHKNVSKNYSMQLAVSVTTDKSHIDQQTFAMCVVEEENKNILYCFHTLKYRFF